MRGLASGPGLGPGPELDNKMSSFLQVTVPRIILQVTL